MHPHSSTNGPAAVVVKGRQMAAMGARNRIHALSLRLGLGVAPQSIANGWLANSGQWQVGDAAGPMPWLDTFETALPSHAPPSLSKKSMLRPALPWSQNPIIHEAVPSFLPLPFLTFHPSPLRSGRCHIRSPYRALCIREGKLHTHEVRG